MIVYEILYEFNFLSIRSILVHLYIFHDYQLVYLSTCKNFLLQILKEDKQLS